MLGCVIQRVDCITIQEQPDGQLVFVKRVGEKIGDVLYGFPLPASISGLDYNNYDANKTDAPEVTNYRADNTCGGHNDRPYNTVDDVEVKADDAKYRSNNIGPADNYEPAIIDKIATNFEANSSKAETTGVGGRVIQYPMADPQHWAA